jgi:lipoate---protein ligase
MKLLDLTLSSPADNLACDEVLLNWADANGGEILRFWEPCNYFVVVGYANKVAVEANVMACKADNIPIFRRCSGGGTVLQGPGCLNYALVLQMASQASLANISGANKFILERNRTAVESVGGGENPEIKISVAGHTDLTLVQDNAPPPRMRKFSGNSQRRHRRALLFHGTFLLNFNFSFVGKFLRIPSKQPDYRNHRDHADFLTNLNLPAARLKNALAKAWNATEEFCDFAEEETRRLAATKYSTSKWNFKL